VKGQVFGLAQAVSLHTMVCSPVREKLSFILEAKEYDGFLAGGRRRLVRPWDEGWRKKGVFPGRQVLLSRGPEGGQDREDAHSMNIAPGSLVIVLAIGDLRTLSEKIS